MCDLVQPSSDCLIYTPIMIVSCAYCRHAATDTVPSTPEHVCLLHAVEFWTGLVAYAVDCAEDLRRRERVYECSEPLTPRRLAVGRPLRLAS